MKKLLFITLIAFSLFSYSQITSYHLVYVKVEDQAKFESVEKNYMSQMAKTAVKEGKFNYWALEKFIHPTVSIGGKLNSLLEGNWYQFVIVYSDLKSYISSDAWWANAGKKLGVPQELLSYEVEQGGMYIWENQDYAFGNETAKYSLYNFGFAEEPELFFDSQKVYKKNFIAQMKQNKAGRAGWVSGHRITTKNWGEHNVMTWDGFLTLEDAMNHLTYKESQKSYDEQGMPGGFDTRFICEKIAESIN